MSALSRAPLVSIGKAVAATVIIGVFMITVPLAPVVLAPFLALPLAYVVARHGWYSGIIVVVVASALLYVGAGLGMAFLVFLILAARAWCSAGPEEDGVSAQPRIRGPLAGGSGVLGVMVGVRSHLTDSSRLRTTPSPTPPSLPRWD
jgi:hypothetical protein